MAQFATVSLLTDETLFNEHRVFRPDSWQHLAMKPVLSYFNAIDMNQLAMIAAGETAWTLLSMTVDIVRQPVINELLLLRMEGVRREGLLYRVETEITAEGSGERIALCTTFYALFDFQKRRICRDEAMLSRYPAGTGTPRMHAESRRKEEHSLLCPAGTQLVPASWMDMVGHANNVRYGELCYNLLPPESMDYFAQVNRLEFYFTGEINRGESLQVLCGERENEILFAGIRSRDGAQSFLAVFTMQP